MMGLLMLFEISIKPVPDGFCGLIQPRLAHPEWMWSILQCNQLGWDSCVAQLLLHFGTPNFVAVFLSFNEQRGWTHFGDIPNRRCLRIQFLILPKRS